MPHDTLAFTGHLAAALVLGAFVGLERQWRQRQAGLRTNALVALAAAAFVSLSTLVPGENSPTRVASYVVSGIGFLGAGVIFRQGNSVQGLNTAATLWTSAAVGVLAGWGFLLEALIVASLVLAANIALRPVGRWVDQRPLSEASELEATYAVRIVCRAADEPGIRVQLLDELSREHLHITALFSEDVKGTDRALVRAVVAAQGRDPAPVERVVSHMLASHGVVAASWSTTLRQEAD